MSKKTTRDLVFKFRLSKAEMKMLKALAKERGVSAADVLRLFIRHEHGKQDEVLTAVAPLWKDTLIEG